MTSSSTADSYVVFSGNVGAGKSTLAQLYAERHGLDCIEEPVPRLTFVDDFFRDPHRWAFHHQLEFLILKGEQELTIARSGRGTCQDRSLAECFDVFARQFHADGWISDREWALLDVLHVLLSRQLRAPDLVVYLTAPVPVLVERIRQRGRHHERALQASWLERLDGFYRRWIDGIGSPVLCLDTGELDVRAPAAREGALARIDAALVAARQNGVGRAR